MQRLWAGEVVGLYSFTTNIVLMYVNEVGTNHPVYYTGEDIRVLVKSMKQAILNTKMPCV